MCFFQRSSQFLQRDVRLGADDLDQKLDVRFELSCGPRCAALRPWRDRAPIARLSRQSYRRAGADAEYVGWAQQGDRVLVFVRLTQARQRSDGSPGNLTRDAFLREWPNLVDR